MAGTINIALTQQFDMDGEPLGGGFLYFFEAASTTPQNAFQDAALTIVHPNPIVLPADGRVPMFYLASTSAEGNPSGQIKIRLTDFTGVTVLAADQLLIIGPAGGSGGGGGGGVDPTTVLQTGDVKARFGVGTLEGFVPCNGETIGSSTSGATERANADCQALFEYLWGTGVLGVFAGTTPARGSTATGDWTANKRIVLPDLRGRTIAGMDDMGATAAAANVLTALGLGVSGIVLGNTGGLQTLGAAQLLQHTHPLLSNVQFGGSLIIGSEADGAGNGQDHSHGWGSLGQFSGGVQGVNGRFATYGSAQAGYDLNHAHNFTEQGFSASNSTAAGGNPPGGSANSNNRTTDTSLNTGYNLDHAHFIDIGGSTGGRSAGHFHAISGSTQLNASTVTAQINVQPTMVLAFYIKL